MKKYIILLSGLLSFGMACVAVSLQNIEVPAIEKPDLSKLKPSPVIKTINSNTVVIVQDGNESMICLTGVEKPVNSADLADKFVSNLLKGESVFVLPDSKQADANNCISAYVYRVPDGLFVNAEIIRQGYGLASMKSLYRFMNEFRHLELFARQTGKGIWAFVETVPSGKQTSAGSIETPSASCEAREGEPNRDTKPLSITAPAGNNEKVSSNDSVIVYVTKSGTKYHSQGCRFLSKSSIPMKLTEAKNRYSPCSVCKPSQ